MLFTDNYISDRFYTNDDINLFYIFNNELEKSFYSSLLGLAIGKILLLITPFNSNFNEIIKKKDNSTSDEDVYKLIIVYKIKTIFLFVIINTIVFHLLVLSYYILLYL